MIEQPSPNCDSRDGHIIDMLVLHYTGMPSAGAAIERLCDPQAQVSSHYVVDEDGSVYRLMPENKRAWHAGVSYWRGHTNINQRSIGVEIVNPGHEFGYRPFPEAQMQAVKELCDGILQRQSIPARNIVAHSDIAPARKEDPGELFSWEELAEYGVGLFPFDPTPHIAVTTELMGLHSYGYDVSDLPKAILAFQRHFRPAKLTGEWDEECTALLAALLEMV
jgi:N-acetylmuramoyl-L-alanine amidase